MAEVTSNADAISALIQEVIDSFDFTLPGEEESLGLDLVSIAVEEMTEQAVTRGLNPDGTPLKPNQAKYAKRKKARYDSDQPGILGGQMLSNESMTGIPVISASRILMLYGTGENPPENARNGTPLTKGERSATDFQKAGYYAKGQRFFYAFDDAGNAERAIVARAGEAFDMYLRELGLT